MLWHIFPCLHLMFLCRRWWISCWTLSSSLVCSHLILSRLSKYPRSCSSMSLCARPCVLRSWWNSWWKTVSYSSLQRTVEQHVDIPVLGGGGPSSGLHVFFPGQRSTSSPTRKRISERIVEQIVDPVSRGSLPGSSSSHSPAGDEERADEPDKGFFRTFPQNKKSAKVTSHSGSELPPHPSSSTAAAQLEDSVEWVRLKDGKSGKPYYWNRRSFSTVWQPPPGVKVVWNATRNEEGARYFWHTETRVSTFALPPLPPG